MFASSTLNTAERNYPQIDKELLGIIFGLEKFNYFVYGQPVQVHTDHKPLLGLANKPLADMSPRLQRLMVRLMKYDVKLSWVEGSKLNLPDALSRAPMRTTTQHETSKISRELHDAVVCQIQTLPIEDLLKVELTQATKSDVKFQKIKEALIHHWPKKKNIGICRYCRISRIGA